MDSFDDKNNFLIMLSRDTKITELTAEMQERVVLLSTDKDDMIRADVAAALVFYPNEQNKSILLTLIEDKNFLVRTEAADALCAYEGKDIYRLLCEKAVADTEYLVRGYAIDSLVLVGPKSGIDKKEISAFLHDRLKVERSLFCKLTIYHALCILGEHEYLKQIYRFLSYKNYRLRIAATHALEDLADENNFAEIEQVVLTARKTEEARSVYCAMDKLLKMKEDIFPPTE